MAVVVLHRLELRDLVLEPHQLLHESLLSLDTFYSLSRLLLDCGHVVTDAMLTCGDLMPLVQKFRHDIVLL